VPAKTPRPSYAEYPAWLKTKLNVEIGPKQSSHYDVASQLIHQQTLQSEFWKELQAELPEAESAYVGQHGFPLYAASQESLTLDRKKWPSFRLKTYRKNVSENERWPKAPRGGWVTFPSWYSRVPDIVRTMVVVRYLDGMTFLAERMAKVAGDQGLAVGTERVATEEGYYATHLDIVGKVTIPDVDWDSIDVDVTVEIQITTQLQDNIRQLLHGGYEAARVAGQTTEWRWKYDSPAFRTNYLGHVLHYLEGMVMSVRERPDGDTKSS
jgi:hypothetical protein